MIHGVIEPCERRSDIFDADVKFAAKIGQIGQYVVKPLNTIDFSFFLKGIFTHNAPEIYILKRKLV